VDNSDSGGFKDSYSGDDDWVRPNWGMKRSTERRFRGVIAQEYGSIGRGLIGYVHNKAIEEYNRRHSGARTRINSPRIDLNLKLERTLDEQEAIGKNRATEIRDKLVGYLFKHSKREKEPRIEVGITELKAAISAISGVNDNRAIRSRITLLRSGRFISQPDPLFENYEIITGYHPDLDSKSKEELR
jgi:hypothetical protein